METEPPETGQNNHPNNSLFAELQVKRENRRASERPEQPQTFNYGAPDEHPINLHDDLDHHHQNSNDEDNEQHHHHESMTESQDTGENSIGSLSPVRSFGSGLLSYLQNWGNSFRRTPRAQPHFPESQPLPHSFPIYQNPVPHLLPDVLEEHDDTHPHSHHHLPELTDDPQNTEPQPEDPEEFSGNTFNLFPHGALIVRTVSPGPDGAVLVRMRVIPMDGIFGEHGEDDEPSPVALFGALVRMLAGGSFLERGLEKEALDSLPVVKYETEAFKNVDSESKRCTICFDDYEDGHELRYLWCLHRFHKGCVDHWLQNHTNCPVCKKDYFEAQKETFVD